MGKIEDGIVYTKLVILAVISFVLINSSHTTIPTLFQAGTEFSIFSILVVASITFVAYEGFQLVIHAVNEMDNPKRNIPKAIYSAVIIATLIYTIISVGAIVAIPFEDIINNKEYALASGTSRSLGNWGVELVIAGALLATSSAISGTLFGASRLMAIVAKDGYFPTFLAKRINKIPVYAVLTMTGLAFSLVLSGSLITILEFSSITFLLVSFLMAFANHKIRHLTDSSTVITTIALVSLLSSTALILYYEISTQLQQVIFIAGIYALLTLGSWIYSKWR